MDIRKAMVVLMIMFFVTACCLPALSSPVSARSSGSGTSGGGMGRGTGVSHSGAGGQSTQSFGTGMSFGPADNSGGAGSESFGPATGPSQGFSGPMTGGGESFGPMASESFQGNQYGSTTMDQYNYNVPYRPEGASMYQQFEYGRSVPGAYRQSPVAAPSSGSAMSLQAQGIDQGTCMWDCTASFTPTECRKRCK